MKLGHIRQHCASSVWKKESFFLWFVYSHEHKLEGGCDVACSRAHRPTITVTEDPMTQIEVVAGPEVKVLASVWKKKKSKMVSMMCHFHRKVILFSIWDSKQHVNNPNYFFSPSPYSFTDVLWSISNLIVWKKPRENWVGL